MTSSPTWAGEPLYYTTVDRVATSTEVTDFPAMVRVGPYNVNPEDSLDFASVISHEYGPLTRTA